MNSPPGAGWRGLRLVLPALLIASLGDLIVLTAQTGKSGLHLADPLLRRTLISPVHILGDHLIETCGKVREVAPKVLAELRHRTVQLPQGGLGARRHRHL